MQQGVLAARCCCIGFVHPYGEDWRDPDEDGDDIVYPPNCPYPYSTIDEWTIGGTCACGGCEVPGRPNIDFILDAANANGCDFLYVYADIWNANTFTLKMGAFPFSGSAHVKWTVGDAAAGQGVYTFESDFGFSEDEEVEHTVDLANHAQVKDVIETEGPHRITATVYVCFPDLSYRAIDLSFHVYCHSLASNETAQPGQVWVYPSRLFPNDNLAILCPLPFWDTEIWNITLLEMRGPFDTQADAQAVAEGYADRLLSYARGCLCDKCGMVEDPIGAGYVAGVEAEGEMANYAGMDGMPIACEYNGIRSFSWGCEAVGGGHTASCQIKRNGSEDWVTIASATASEEGTSASTTGYMYPCDQARSYFTSSAGSTGHGSASGDYYTVGEVAECTETLDGIPDSSSEM